MDLSLLVKNGPINHQNALRVWEQIVKQSERANNSLAYYNRLEQLRNIADLAANYIIVRASLNKLLRKFDRAIVNDLAARGYVVDTTNSEKYAESVYNNLQNVRNLITKLTMAKKEIEFETTETKKEEGARGSNFDFIMANLLVEGIAVRDDITYARFIEIGKAMKAKRKGKSGVPTEVSEIE